LRFLAECPDLVGGAADRIGDFVRWPTDRSKKLSDLVSCLWVSMSIYSGYSLADLVRRPIVWAR
jgi:hypothetical protein